VSCIFVLLSCINAHARSLLRCSDRITRTLVRRRKHTSPAFKAGDPPCDGSPGSQGCGTRGCRTVYADFDRTIWLGTVGDSDSCVLSSYPVPDVEDILVDVLRADEAIPDIDDLTNKQKRCVTLLRPNPRCGSVIYLFVACDALVACVIVACETDKTASYVSDSTLLVVRLECSCHFATCTSVPFYVQLLSIQMVRDVRV
jgi:hypothetical protein